MSKLQVICIGEALIDKIINKSDSNFKNYLGGAPANVACALRKLNVPTAFIGCLGNDDFGKEFIKLFKKLEINIEFLQIAKQSSTRVVRVVRDTFGDRSFSGFESVGQNAFADELLDKFSIIKNKNLRKQFLNTDYIVTGTNILASPKSSEFIFFILDYAKGFNIKFVIDVNWRDIFWDNFNTLKEEKFKKVKKFLNYSHILKLASEEAKLISCFVIS